jgi:hypothetical protein
MAKLRPPPPIPQAFPYSGDSEMPNLSLGLSGSERKGRVASLLGLIHSPHRLPET